MRPTRRVLLSIGVLVVALVATLFVVWHLQTRALGDALVSDITATLARRIERDPPPTLPEHDNGYECFGEMVDVTPKDLSPFEAKDKDRFHELFDGGVPEPVQQKMATLERWADSVRHCGDSARLKFVPGLTPFTTAREPRGERGSQVVLALGRLTRLQARLLADEGQWESIAVRCAGTLEVALDRSHLNLIGAMVAAGAVKQLVPACGEALQHLSPEARPTLAARFKRLQKRLADNHEFVDAERLLVSLGGYGWLMSPEQRAQCPASDFNLGETNDLLLRFALARIWPRYDRAMRRLVTSADVPGPARLDADQELSGVFRAWWVPTVLDADIGFEKFFQRNEDTQVLLQLLTGLAEGGEKPLPARVTRTPAGLEFTDFKGEKLVVPAAQGAPPATP
jgi:hypothetical protein